LTIQRVPGEASGDWLMRKYGAQLEELLSRVAKLEKKK